VECVPNFSEGRRKEVVDAIAKSIASVPGVRLLDTEMDPDHNRCVITFVGDRNAVAEAAFQGAKSAVARIDMNHHRGEHPRVGALDVLPFVPISGVTMDRSEEHTSELQSRRDIVCRLLLEKKKNMK